MGDIADMMLDGTLDAMTGEYIGRGHGYPRTLDRSLPWEKGQGRVPNAKFGVTNWLNLQGITDKADQMKVIRSFFPEDTSTQSREALCLEISKRFADFKKHVNTKI